MGLWRAIGAFLKGLWYALDGLRRVLHLVLLLIIFGALLAVSHTTLPIIPRSAALELAPLGSIVEEESGDPLDRALNDITGEDQQETRLRDLVDVVDHARDDDRIRALVLNLDGLDHAGLPELQDLARSIRWRSPGSRLRCHRVVKRSKLRGFLGSCKSILLYELP